MSEFTQAALQLSQDGDASWLRAINEQGRARWLNTPFPTRKSEHWKYTSLRALEAGDYLRWPVVADDEGLESLANIDGLDSVRVVFVNGQFDASLSTSELPGGLEITLFSEADTEQQQRIAARLATIADSAEHPFAALNESWLQDGLYVRVAANSRVEQPIQVVSLTTAQDHNFCVQQRLLVELEAGAEATLIEHFTSTRSAQTSFTNAISEFLLADNARLQHYRLHLEEEHALHIGGVHASLLRSAQLNSFMVGLGSSLQRVDVGVQHRGEGAHCDLNGVYLPHNKQLVDFHTRIDHFVPHCTSREIFRGIIGDSAKAVFNGRIIIHPDAQKSLAEMSNKNLLTSPDAEIDTKPELEIYADDVKCAHGATVAQLDEKAVYYLRSRGVSLEDAEVMLSFGFINELLEEIALSPVRELLNPVLGKLFSEEFEHLRHVA